MKPLKRSRVIGQVIAMINERIGDYVEAKDLLTGIKDMIEPLINNFSNARNELLAGWVESGGRESFWYSISLLIDSLIALGQKAIGWFHKIFPPMTIDRLLEITYSFEAISDAINYMVTGPMENEQPRTFADNIFQIGKALGSTFLTKGGLASVILGLTLFKKALNPFKVIGTVFSIAAGKTNLFFAIFKMMKWPLIAAGVGIVVGKLIELGNSFGVFDGLKAKVTTAFSVLSEFWTILSGDEENGLYKSHKDFFEKHPILSFLTTIGPKFEAFKKNVKTAFSDFGSSVSSKVTEVFATLKEFWTILSGDEENGSYKSHKDFFEKHPILSFLTTISPRVAAFNKVVKETFSSFTTSVKANVSSAFSVLKEFWTIIAGVLASYKQTAQTEGISGLFKRLSSEIATLAQNVSESLKRAWSSIEAYFEGLASSNVFTNFKDAFLSGIEPYKNAFAQFGTDEFFPMLARALFGARGALADELYEDVGVELDTAKKSFTKQLSDWWESFKMSDFATNVGEKWNTLTSWISGAFAKIASFGEGVNWGAVKTVMLMDILPTIEAIFNGLGFIALGRGAQKRGKALLIFAKNMPKVTDKLSKGFESINEKNFLKGLSDLANSLKQIKITRETITKTENITKDSIGKNILNIAKSIGILVASLWVLTKINPNEIEAALKIMGGILAALVFVSILTSKKNAGKGILNMAEGLTLMLLPMFILSKMKPGTLIKGGLALVTLVFGVCTAISLIGKTSIKPATFITLSIAMLIMTGIVKSLGSIDFGTAAQGVGYFIGILAVIVACQKLLDGKNIEVKGMLGFAASLWIMAKVVKTLGKIKAAQTGRVLLALIPIIAAVAGAMYVTKHMEAPGVVLMKLAILAGSIFAVSLAIGMLFRFLSGVNPKDAIAKLGGIALIMISFGALTKLMEKINPIAALKTLGEIALVIVGIPLVLGALNEVTGGGVVNLLNSGGTVLEAIGRAIGKFFGGIKNGATTAANAVNMSQLETDALSAEKAVNTMSAIGRKNVKTQLESANKYIQSVANILYDVAEPQGATARERTVDTTKIKSFIDQVALISDDIIAFKDKMVDADMSGAKNDMDVAVGAMTSLTTSVVSLISVGNFNKTDLRDKINSISDLGQALKIFSTNVAGFSSGKKHTEQDLWGEEITEQFASQKDIDAAMSIAQQMVGFAIGLKDSGVETSGGLWGLIVGNLSLEDFSEQFPVVGKNLRAFSDTVSSFASGGDTATKTEIDRAIGVAEGLIGLQNALSGDRNGMSGHFVTSGFMQSDWALTDFSNDFPTLANNLQSFSDSLAGFSTGKIDPNTGEQLTASKEQLEDAVTVANSLADLESALEVNGGVIQWFSGQRDLGNFAQNVSDLTAGLSAYAENAGAISTIDTGELINVVAGMELAMMIAAGYADYSLLGKYITGQGIKYDPLKVISEQISEDASSLKESTEDMTDASENEGTDFAKLMEFASGNGYDISGLTKLTEGFDGLSGSLEKFSGIAGMFGENGSVNVEGLLSTLLFSGAKSPIGDKTNQMDPTSLVGKTFVDEYTDLQNQKSFEGTSGFFDQKIGTFATNLEGLGTGLLKVNEGVSATKDIAAIAEEATQSIKTMIRNFAGLDSEMGDWDNYDFSRITSIMLSIYQGLTDEANVAIVVNGVDELINTATSTLSTYVSEFVTQGANYTIGLANGIISRIGAVRTAARAIAGAAVLSSKNTLREKSPSKISTEQGEYYGIGLANGISSTVKMVSDSASGIADTAIESARNVISSLAAVMNMPDTDMTIRPVFDMSNVENGFTNMDNLFAQQRTVSAGLFDNVNIRANIDRLAYDDDGRVSGSANNGDIIAKLSELGDRFDSMSEAVKNMQIILDTGTLVGETSARMDEELGIIAGRRGRGN